MKRWAIRVSLAILVLAVALLLGAWLWVRASLPVLDGELAVSGLAAPVVVTRDSLGVATIRASNMNDLARATGFVHAQERFFQMDLLRRSAAGEIAALVGAAAVDYDRGRRIHDLRDVARRIVAASPESDRALLVAYAEGVNAGLAALGARPFEYGVLRMQPQAWLPEDSLLAVFAMYFDLHDENARRKRYLAALHEVFPAEFVDFLVPAGTQWDAPVAGPAFEAPPIPGPHVIDFRERDTPLSENDDDLEMSALAPGSNSWAVDGERSASGVPVIANDMHLGLGVPNVWFRLRLELDAPHGFHVTGVSLPGAPVVAVGSNGNIAWSFTNSYGDFIDLVRLDVDGCENGYRTPEGCEELEVVSTEIAIAHADSIMFEYSRARWGPVVESSSNGDELLYALRWTAHDPAATNLRLHDLAGAADVPAAIEIAHSAGIPPQNFIVADREGNTAWTIIGRIPRRVEEGRLPLDSATSGEVWNGWLEPHEYPLVMNPAHGRLWSANARMIDGEHLQLLGDSGYSLGARAAQIRDRLFEQDRFTVEDMLSIQLDDTALFLSRWRQLLLDLLDANAMAEAPDRQALHDAVANWEGHAAADSVSYRVVRTWRDEVMKKVFGGLTAEVRSEFPGFGFGAFTQTEGPLWQLVTARPAHLLPPGYDDWRGLLMSAADEVQDAAGDLGQYHWGARNVTRIDHPLGRLPLLGLLLNAPRTGLPGDIHMPRVQGPGFGASERFAVSPGREDEGYFHMPGGQSGHPLSPHYLAGHDDWEEGRPAPFLPGAAKHQLTLIPVTTR